MTPTFRGTAVACLVAGMLAFAAGCTNRSATDAPAKPPGLASVATVAPASPTQVGPPTPASGAAIADVAPAPAATVAGAAPAPASAVSVALDPEGLRLFVNATGSSRLVAFGAPQADVASQLSHALPEPQQLHPEDTDCGAMILLPRSGLRVYFRDGEFTGWGVDDASTLTTAAGIGIGSTRKALEAVVVPEMFADSTLGHEFTAGGIAGMFASGAKDARIIHLWAGDTCIAR